MTPPDPNGTIIRIVDLEPRSRSPMHRTESIDYGIVLAGEVILVLDDGSETLLGPGDVVVQRGTDHAWVNQTDGAGADGLRARGRPLHRRARPPPSAGGAALRPSARR